MLASPAEPQFCSLNRASWLAAATRPAIVRAGRLACPFFCYPVKAPVLLVLTDFLPAADHALASMEQAGLVLGLPPTPPTTLPWCC